MMLLVSPERILHHVREQEDGGEQDLKALIPRGTEKRAQLLKNLRQLLGWTGVGNSTGDANDRNDRKETANW